MTSGRKISDHSFWGGKGGKESAFPMGCKTKMDSSAEGAGAVGRYSDTSESIRADQEKSISMAKRHAMKSGEIH
jgi:hypothetical protein